MGRFARESSGREVDTVANILYRHNIGFTGDFGGCVGAGCVARRALGRLARELTSPVPIECDYVLADRWSKDARRVFDENEKLQVWRPDFDAGDVLECTATPFDGTDSGSPMTSAPVTVDNSAPSVASVSITPTTAYTTTTLAATPSGWSDEDGEPGDVRSSGRSQFPALPSGSGRESGGARQTSGSRAEQCRRA